MHTLNTLMQQCAYTKHTHAICRHTEKLTHTTVSIHKKHTHTTVGIQKNSP